MFVAESSLFSGHMVVVGFFPLIVDVTRMFINKSSFGIKVNSDFIRTSLGE